MKRIVLTGGGTAGHVTPNIALIPTLKKSGYEIFYIGTENGIEKQLIEREGIKYFSISAGKLRRYLDMKNITDTFKISKGYFEALSIIKKIKPDIVFSKGGFVSCPVVWAAWTKKIPVVIHESDMTPGLANKLSMPFSKKICYTFPETAKHLPKEKRVLAGIPVRASLFEGDREKGRKLCGFQDTKPVIMIIGGSLGSGVLNKTIRESLDKILPDFNVCHICGKGNIDNNYNETKGYKQFEYINEEQPHIFALSDIVVSRAGATILFEILSLKKPNLLIPLSKNASRGDQILNANSFKKQGFSSVIMEEELELEKFVRHVKELYSERQRYVNAMSESKIPGGVEGVTRVIEECIKNK